MRLPSRGSRNKPFKLWLRYDPDDGVSLKKTRRRRHHPVYITDCFVSLERPLTYSTSNFSGYGMKKAKEKGKKKGKKKTGDPSSAASVESLIRGGQEKRGRNRRLKLDPKRRGNHEAPGPKGDMGTEESRGPRVRSTGAREPPGEAVRERPLPGENGTRRSLGEVVREVAARKKVVPKKTMRGRK